MIRRKIIEKWPSERQDYSASTVITSDRCSAPASGIWREVNGRSSGRQESSGTEHGGSGEGLAGRSEKALVEQTGDGREREHREVRGHAERARCTRKRSRIWMSRARQARRQCA